MRVASRSRHRRPLNDLVVYDGDAMLLATSIPVCGDLFTSDVASVFKVSSKTPKL